jgi:transposase-like protein
MKCPHCASEVEVETFDICNHGPVDGIEVFFECKTCNRNFGAHVLPAAFTEFSLEDPAHVDA